MASTSSRIQIIIDGATRGIEAAAARARTALAGIRDEAERNDKIMSKVGSGLGTFAKGVAALGALGGVVQVVAGVTAAVQQLLPIVLAAPGAILVLGAAFATFKIATAGFADAVKSGDLSQLSPQARAAASELRALGKAFEPVKRAVQDRFFRNFAADVQAIGSTYLPILAQKLPKIADGFNEMGRSIAFALTRPAAVGDIEDILDATAKALHNARNAAGSFISGFLGLGAIGATYMPALGRAIDGVAIKFKRFVDQGVETGRIKELIDGAIQGFKDLGAIVVNIGSAIGSVFRGLAGPQADVLGGLRDTTAALATFLQTASAQDALRALGDALRVIADVTRSVLIAALEQLAPIIENLAPVVAEIARVMGETLVNAIGIVGPLLEGLSGFLRDHKEVVGLVANALLLLYGRFLLLKGITVVVGAIRGVTAALGGLSNLLKVGGFVALGAIAVEIDKINVAAAGGDPEKLTGLADNLHNIVGAGKELASLDFAGIFADIQSELDQIGQGFSTGSSPIGGFVKDVTANVQEFARVTGESFGQIGQYFSGVGQNISEFATKTGESIGKIVTFFIDLPVKIGEALGQAGATLLQKGAELVQSILDGARTKFEEVKAFFQQSPYEIGFAIGAQIGILLQKGIDLVEQLRLGAVQKFEEVKTFFLVTVPTEIANSLTALSTTLLAKGVEAMTALGTGSIQAFEGVKTFFLVTVPTEIANALLVLGPQLAAKAVEAMNAFLAALAAPFAQVIGLFTNLPGQIITAVAPATPGLSAQGTAAGGGFLTGIRAKMDEAAAFVAGIPQRIVDAFVGANSLLLGIGRSIIDGLTAGLKEGYQAMIQFVSGIAAGIAANKGPLPYDRRVLIPAGLALMEGLRTGLRTGYGDVEAFVGTIAGGLAGTLDAGTMIRSATAASAAFGARGPSGRTQDDTPTLLRQLIAAQQAGADVRVYLGDRELRDLVRTEVGGRDRATVRTVTTGTRAV